MTGCYFLEKHLRGYTHVDVNEYFSLPTNVEIPRCGSSSARTFEADCHRVRSDADRDRVTDRGGESAVAHRFDVFSASF